MDPTTHLPWHHSAWSRFANSIARDSVAHALLVHGEGGLHKVHLARQFGHALLCSEVGADAHACGRCKSCLLLRAGTHPDWLEITNVDSAVIKIDQIRALSERLSMRPQIGERQVALIFPAERMNSAAANALLKTLEEPTPDTHLLLVADRIGQLAATIRSRCQRLAVAPVGDAAGLSALATLAGVDVTRARAALALAHGDPEAAQALLEPANFAQISEVGARLSKLARGELSASAFAALYARNAAQLLLSWSALIGFAMRAEPLSLPVFDDLVRLTSSVEMSRLLPLATQLERARGLLGSGVREDLLVYELSCRWAELQSQERDRRA
jgi:DNA polymerase-3 subunit delta'